MQARDILKASMHSNTVLTDVFLSENSIDVFQPKNKKARTSSAEKNKDKIPDYYF